MPYDRIFAALADPTRRKLLESIRRRDRTVNELASVARITQPAASQHLRVLVDARLATNRREGTRRYYRARAEGLADLRRYIESFWGDALAAFAAADPKKKGASR